MEILSVGSSSRMPQLKPTGTLSSSIAHSLSPSPSAAAVRSRWRPSIPLSLAGPPRPRRLPHRPRSSLAGCASPPPNRPVAELNRAPSFLEVFDRTHKKKGTNQFVSERACSVAETYNRHVTEKYGEGDAQQTELDPMAWVAATGVPKKDRLYGFGQSLKTSMVISSCSSSGAVPTSSSAFSTPPPGPSTSPSDVRDIVRAEMSILLQQMRTKMSSQKTRML